MRGPAMSKAKIKYAIREAQSKSKQKEFGIEKSKYPRFRTNSDDLDFQSIFSIIEYAQNLLSDSVDQDLIEDISLAATYFDAALNYDEKQQYSNEYLLFGASAYFLAGNFGNAVTLINRAIKNQVAESSERRLAYLLASLLSTSTGVLEFEKAKFYELVDSFISGEGDASELEILCEKIDKESIIQGQQLDSLFNIITRSIVKMSSGFLAAKLMPQYTGVDFAKIMEYLKPSKMPVMLWPSQIEIGKAGGYAGNNLIIQAPTGSGKTKSIEFIIASAFASEKAKNAVIVAPLRSLCEEISESMKGNLKNVNVNSVSDILQENDFAFEDSYNILVLTPEKLEYILFHNSNVLETIDLFVFDEGHMIDDDHRGASFELLLTHIKNNAHYKQLIFISAVIPNGEQLGEWLFRNHTYQSLSHKDIPSTSKHIAVLGNNADLDFYKLSDFSDRDYYVQNSIKSKNIPTKAGKESKKFFPEDRRDVALYYADLLIPNGSLAIYFGARKRIDGCLKRINFLRERNFLLNNIASSVNGDQVRKLLCQIEIHYGRGEYYNAAECGVLVHYADLEEGLKRTAEDYLKRQYSKLILCTSTLSEGVNLPIKYLIMTETSNYMYEVTTRKLINLIGRAARSGHYTEGSIIVTEQINNASELETKFSDKHSEDCRSCFCDLVNEEYDFSVNGTHIATFNVYKHVIEAVRKEDYFLYDYQERTRSKLQEHDYGNNSWAKSKFIIKFDNLINKCRSSIEAIFIFIQNTICNANELEKEEIRCILGLDIDGTYGYSLMSAEEKTRFCNLVNVLFDAIYDKSLEVLKNHKYIPTAKITEIEKIIEWSSVNSQLLNKDDLEFTEELGRLFYENHSNIEVSCEVFLKILHEWVNGSPFICITNTVGMNIVAVEKVCKKQLSYGLSMYFGHLIDLTDNEDEMEKLQFIQKRVKYGLPDKKSIDLYESGLADRFICQKVSDDVFLTQQGMDTEKFLEQFPDWIRYRYNSLKAQ